MRKNRFLVLVALLLLACSAQGAIKIDVGDHLLLPDRAGQEIVIPVTRGAGDSVQGLNLLVQIGDGGSVLGGTDGSWPRITDVDLVGATIFSGNHNGNTVVTNSDHFWEILTTTEAGTVAPDGALARITLDTTGLLQGEFDLKLGGILDQFDTDFAGVAAEIVNGRIRIIPEPAGLLLLVGLGCLTLLPIRRLSRV